MLSPILEIICITLSLNVRSPVGSTSIGVGLDVSGIPSDVSSDISSDISSIISSKPFSFSLAPQFPQKVVSVSSTFVPQNLQNIYPPYYATPSSRTRTI